MLNACSKDSSRPLQVAPERRDTKAAIASRFSHLPPFHVTALHLLGIAVDSRTAIEDFEDVFRVDPAITTDLLLMANSAVFAPRARIETIRHAITYLGVDRIRSLASTIAFGYQVRNAPQSPALTAVWRHSVATAVIAEKIGLASLDSSALYTAGLMHDTGRLGLLVTAGQPYAESFALEFADIAEANTLETAIAGMTHCEAGGCLARVWNLPPTLQAAIVKHHDSAADDSTIGVVQMACKLADSLGFVEVRLRDIADPQSLLPEALKNKPELQPEQLSATISAQLASFQ
jgi:HD-like signal output (HDOD) protein